MKAIIVNSTDKEFYLKNRSQLAVIYRGKWCVIYHGRILFYENTEHEMLSRAINLGLKTNDYSFFHVYGISEN